MSPRWPREVADDEVLNFVRMFIAAEGYSPSLRQIARGVGLSGQTAVLHHIRRLEENGMIRRAKRTPRSIVVMR